MTTDQIRIFFDYLRHDYTPRRWNGGTHRVSALSARNYWAGLRSFGAWAKKELEARDIIDIIDPPKVISPPLSHRRSRMGEA